MFWNHEINTFKINVVGASISKMNKQLVIENIILRFEALLPATCGTCKDEYCAGMEDPPPTLACHGCAQGFHQKCLETLLGGITVFPTFPGITYWLCPLCAPVYSSPVTTQGGLERPKFRRRRLSPVEDLNIAAAAAAETSSNTAPPIIPAPPPLPTIQPTGEQEHVHPDQVEGEDCPEYLLGTCQFGISGKLNGQCPNLHKKRCLKYMKWGNKHINGCKSSPCPKAHPALCIKSLDLKCLDKHCPVRVHTSKCVRWKPHNAYRGGSGDNGSRVVGGHNRGSGVTPSPWHAGRQARGVASHPPWGVGGGVPNQSTYPRQGSENQAQVLGFQPLTVQQMLEAQQKMFGDMMVQFQQQMHHSLQQYQATHQVQGVGGGGQHPRPFSFPTFNA